MTGPATAQALERLARPVRARARAGWLAAGLGVAALLLGLAAWLARLGAMTAPWWVLAAWAVAVLAVVGVAVQAWRRDSGLRLRAFARRLEESGHWRTGAISTLLDPPAAGTSPALLGVADRAQAAALAEQGRAAASPLARAATETLMVGAGCLAVGVGALVSAGPVRGPAAALWHPGRAWFATTAPLRLSAEATEVEQGASVPLLIDAAGRREATLWLRAPGESWRATPLALDSAGRARYVAGPLRSDLFARVTSGSRSSDTVAVKVRLPVFIGAVSVVAHYPSYLKLDAEPVPTAGDTVLLPAGTRLETRGEATAPLAAAAWTDGARAESLAVTAARFAGSFVPRESGTWRLALATRSGRPLAGDSIVLPIRVVPDSAPTVEIPVPGVDTIAPLSLQVPLVIDVRDDHGIRAVQLESRRIGRLGEHGPLQRDVVPLPEGLADRGILSFTMDLNRRGLLPGDTVRYRAVATDNSPRAQRGQSHEFVLRLPTMSEVRAAQRQATRSIAGQIDSVAATSRRLERATEDLAREQPRTAGRDPSRPDALPYDQAKRAEQVAADQHRLLEQAQRLKDALAQLEKSAEAAGVRDSAWQRQLAEIRQQLERALTPELREKLEALQRALKDLNAEDTKQALQDLAEHQRQLREALEQSKELFRRAAVEGDLANLTQESRDLVREQRQWSDQVRAADSARAAAAERQLAGRTDSLAAALHQLAPQMPNEARQQALAEAAKQAKQAAQQMQQAAKAAQQGQRQPAAQRGQQAADQLQPLGDQLQQQREGMQQEWRKEVTDALDRALAETTRLAQRQLAVANGFQRGAPPGLLRGEQAAVEEGVARLQQQLKQVAGKNALVPPQIAQALAGAQLEMQRSREAVSSANPNVREAAERAGSSVDALNVAAYAMLRARENVSGSQSGSGLAEAIEQMKGLAGQQGQLAEQTGGLLPMAGAQGLQERLRQLGAQQRALGEELEKMRGRGTMPGAGEMADEAKDLARRLEAQRLDRDVVERQQRLFRRMLDAGRTLQGQEEDQQKERQSTPAANDSVHLPPALRAKLVDENRQLRMPSWAELQQLSPEERRLVLDYFRRLNEGSPR